MCTCVYKADVIDCKIQSFWTIDLDFPDLSNCWCYLCYCWCFSGLTENIPKFSCCWKTENCRTLFCLLLNSGVKLQLVTELGFFFVCVCLLWNVLSLCEWSTKLTEVWYSCNLILHIFSAKQCTGHSHDERENHSIQCDLLTVLWYSSLFVMFWQIKIFFVGHWNHFNPVYHKIGWHCRIYFNRKDKNETWLCLFYSWHLWF